jgi:hypothetical protein
MTRTYIIQLLHVLQSDPLSAASREHNDRIVKS